MKEQRRKKREGITSVLAHVGLSANEILIYESLLGQEPLTALALSRSTPLSRTMVYHTLDVLIQKKLVTTTSTKWKTVFTAQSPEYLRDLLRVERTHFEQREQQLQKCIPALLKRHTSAVLRPSARTLDGVDGLQEGLSEMLDFSGGCLYEFAPLGVAGAPTEVLHLFEKKRIHKKIHKKVLFNENTPALKALGNYTYNDFTQFRSQQKSVEKTITHAHVLIAEERILIITYLRHDVSALLIHNKALAEHERGIFMQLWQKGKERTLYVINTHL